MVQHWLLKRETTTSAPVDVCVCARAGVCVCVCGVRVWCVCVCVFRGPPKMVVGKLKNDTSI